MKVRKILATSLIAGMAALLFAACEFIPTLGETEPEAPAPTTAGGAASQTGGGASGQTQIPQATRIADTGAGSSESGASTPEVVVNQGHSVKQWSSPPTMTIDPTASYTAVIDTTAGPITVELLPGEAPSTVNNFVFLARQGFYNNVIFHRTIPGFMIQGGDPTGTGGGGPGYRFPDEPVQRPYSRGVLAMANAGPDTNGSQFFIMHADYGLPPSYTIFGQAVAGLETIDAIATAPTQPGGEGSTPVNPVVIQSVEIVGP